MRDVVPKINGGAVKEERSPLNDAMDCYSHQFKRGVCEAYILSRMFTFRKDAHDPLF